MNKKICFLVFVLIIVIGVFILNRTENTVWITDNEFLYDKAIEYVVKQSSTNGYYNDENDYNIFTDYEGFGIEEKKNKKIVYMWILKEEYYVKNNELEMGEGSSMPYKFVFENNEVVDYEVPKDGSYYTSSIKDMFPNSIENEVLSYEMKDTKLKEQVKDHYSYLDSIDKTITNTYFNGTVVEVGKTYIIVEPDEESNEKKSSDKISIGTNEWNSEFIVGNRVKIIYDGTIMESYPAQIDAIDIELIN